MREQFALGVFVLVVIIVAAYVIFEHGVSNERLIISSFDECVAAKNPITESYPRQCTARDGKTFTEDIGNAIEKKDFIKVAQPIPNIVITNPLIIKGEARGYWFFEASFPIRLYDENGKLLATTIAQAKSEWMTTDFVPFEATLEFQKPAAKKGALILEKDNPSGLPQYADELRVPVSF